MRGMEWHNANPKNLVTITHYKMKKYTLTTTIILRFEAESQKKAEEIAENMSAVFEDSETAQHIDHDWIDWELNEVEQ
jgi:ACT domain-containing protein